MILRNPLLFPLLLLLWHTGPAARVALAGPALPFTGSYTESFNTLPSSGSVSLTGTGTAGGQADVPGLTGWQAARVGGTSTTDLTLATTSGTTGRLYAFGEAGDRALGSLASGSTVAAVGIALRNTSGLTFGRVTLRYARGVWLTQGTSTANAFEDRLRFAWGIDSAGTTTDNFLTHPTLTPFPGLDALSESANTVTSVTGSTTPDRQRPGQRAPWRQPVSATLTDLHWAPGQTLYLRWIDRDDAGFDAGLALDDVQVEAAAGPFRVAVGLEAATPQQIRLQWPTRPGAQYRLEESSRLESWQPVAGFPQRAGGFSWQHDHPVTAGSRFFRVWETDPAPSGQEVYFTAPGPTGTEADLTFERKLQDLLEQAPAGSSVRAAIYTWTRESMSEAFIGAHTRGVDVRLIVGSDFPAVDLLLAALPGRVTICRDGSGMPNGCQGGRINHNKFVLFSALADGTTHVTIQSSANFTDLQLSRANNLVIIRRDAALHAAYLQYWQDLASQPLNPDYYRTAHGDAGTKVWFFPRASANGTTGAGDPIVEELNKIDPPAGGSIRITMAFWTSPRRAIAQRLVALHQAGCRVSVVTHPQETSAEILQILQGGGIPVSLLAPIHSKYLLMDAVYEGRRQQLVFTGSHNYTGPALTENDETLLRLAHPGLYEAFLADWRRLAAHPLVE